MTLVLVLILVVVFFETSYCKSPVMALVEQLKRHVAERSFQRSLNNETFDYKSIQIYMRMK